MTGIMQMFVAGGGAGGGSATYTASVNTTYSWVAPSGVTSVSVVVVGMGCTVQAGTLAYTNNITVTPGCSYTVGINNDVFGSYFRNNCTVRGSGGGASPSGKGDWVSFGAASNGTGCYSDGAGGAGGYSGCAFSTGKGGAASGGAGSSGCGGSGGGGGGGVTSVTCFFKCGAFWYIEGYAGGGGGGGGVGVCGSGSSGAGGAGGTGAGGGGAGGKGGSGGANGGAGTAGSSGSAGNGGTGGFYGGAGGRKGYYEKFQFINPCYCCPCATLVSQSIGTSGTRGAGVVRIVWPGDTRKFPSTNVGAP
jgi:hypothetical protein